MIAKPKTKDVKRSAYANYLKKAEECFDAAEHAFKKEDWNACAINAIHCCITACDAMCAFYLGKRHSGENHNEAVVLFKSIQSNEAYKTNANRVSKVLSMKNMAEYEERLVRKTEAEKIFKDTERFLSFVHSSLTK